MGICTDITEQEQSARRLASADKQSRWLLFDLERTIEAMNIGVVLLDADLNVEIINPAFREIWALSNGEVAVGCPVRALIDSNRGKGSPDLPDDEWEAYVAGVVDEIRIGDVALPAVDLADGRTIVYSIVNLSGGKRLATYYDVTDMKQREHQLAATRERSHLSEAILDAIDDPIFIKDENLRFVFANKAFARVFGETPERMLGHEAVDFSATGRRGPLREFRTAGAGVRTELRDRGELRSARRHEDNGSFASTASPWRRASTMSPASSSTSRS